jgi:hypothetical protein
MPVPASMMTTSASCRKSAEHVSRLLVGIQPPRPRRAPRIEPTRRPTVSRTDPGPYGDGRQRAASARPSPGPAPTSSKPCGQHAGVEHGHSPDSNSWRHDQSERPTPRPCVVAGRTGPDRADPHRDCSCAVFLVSKSRTGGCSSTLRATQISSLGQRRAHLRGTNS